MPGYINESYKSVKRGKVIQQKSEKMAHLDNFRNGKLECFISMKRGSNFIIIKEMQDKNWNSHTSHPSD